MLVVLCGRAYVVCCIVRNVFVIITLYVRSLSNKHFVTCTDVPKFKGQGHLSGLLCSFLSPVALFGGK